MLVVLLHTLKSMLQVLIDGLSMELSGSQDIMCVARRSFLTSVQERTWSFQRCVPQFSCTEIG